MNTKQTEKEFLDAYNAHADAIFRRCLFKTSDREVALDITQDTFTRAWEYVRQGKVVQNMRAFLFTTANNAIIDYYRKKKPVYEHQLSNPELILDHISEDHTERKADLILLMKCLDQLSPEHKDMLLMRYTEGLSLREIGEILSERANTIAVQIHRSIKSVRNCLHI